MKNTIFTVDKVEYSEINPMAANTNQTLYFPDMANLRNARIFGISGITTDVQTTSESGATVITKANAKNIIVNLYFENGTFIKMPMLSMTPTDGTGFFALPIGLAGQNILWAKSFIFCTTAATAAAISSGSVPFNIFYSLPPVQNR